MGIKEVRAPRHRGTVLPVAKVAQQGLFGDADTHAEQTLVIVRALHGEQPQQRAGEARPGGRRHRSHSVAAIPPPRPAANHARFGPRPTSRSVPAAPDARAAATAATARSVKMETSRGDGTPASKSRAIQARPRPAAVTSAARTPSRINPP